MNAFDICLNTQCNNRCLMCTNPDKVWPAWDGSISYSKEALIQRISKSKSVIDKCNKIYITGGEPTIHPEFIYLLKYLTRTFPKHDICLLTNGRKCLYKNFAMELLKINKKLQIEVSLYGPDQETHDAVTRSKNSFIQTVGGVKNLLHFRGNEQIINLRIVITRLSYKKLDDYFVFVKNNFPSIDSIIILFHEMEQQAVKNKKVVAIRFKDFQPYLRKAKKYFNKFNDVRLYHFPLCVIDGEMEKFAHNTLPEEEIAYLPVCEKCLKRKKCVGIHKGYLKIFGQNEFKAITK